MRRVLALFLACAGYACVVAESGEAALEMLRAEPSFGVLVTDHSMPGMTGCELIEKAARLRPSLPALLITGYDGIGLLERLGRHVPVLRKPFDRSEFVTQVRALLLPPGAIASQGEPTCLRA